jgi:hypothetical protein
MKLNNFKKNYSDILIRPKIVSSYMWTKGYFYTIGNEEITEDEKILDYGFFASMWNKYSFFKETGEQIDHIPKISGTYGATVPMGILHEIAIEFAIDPTILGDYKEEDHLNDSLIIEETKLTATEEFEKDIKPFFFVDQGDKSLAFCLDVGEYKKELFELREKEGFCGNGYDWESLAREFIKEKCPEITSKIDFDPEADLFCAYSKNKKILKKFALDFKNACENDELIKELFLKSELA